ncbi:MAG TPA: hypothetical protein VEL74_13560 [Thermoanaerobaculia bacterium]|nr:hypothetical protein [Thermoanaerobaculia bacterium]
MNGKKILAAALVAGALAAVPAFAVKKTVEPEELWLHVKVHAAEGDERTTINLPLSLVQGFIALVPDTARGSAKIRVNDREVSVPELRTMWRGLRHKADTTWMTTDSRDGKMRIAKRGGYLYIQAEDRTGGNEQAEIRIPATVVDALLSGKDDELELGAAISALARHGEGELVAVNSENETVRIWVDGESVGRR